MKNTKHPIWKSSGFTLVEMLVATAIIGVLSSLMVPSIRHASEHGKCAKCIGNLRQIGVAVNQYVADPSNERQFPPLYTAGVSNSDMNSGPQPASTLTPLEALQSYGVNLALLSCPSDRSPNATSGSYVWTPVLQGEAAQDPNIYSPGGANNIVQLSQLTVCTDNGHPHQGSFNVLRADGHVETKPSASATTSSSSGAASSSGSSHKSEGEEERESHETETESHEVESEGHATEHSDGEHEEHEDQDHHEDQEHYEDDGTGHQS